MLQHTIKTERTVARVQLEEAEKKEFRTDTDYRLRLTLVDPEKKTRSPHRHVLRRSIKYYRKRLGNKGKKYKRFQSLDRRQARLW